MFVSFERSFSPIWKFLLDSNGKTKRKFKIISKGGVGEYRIVNDGGQIVAAFAYRNWLSSSGSAYTDQGKISIKSKNKWDTCFSILRARVEVGEIIFHWRDNIAIALKDHKAKLRQFVLSDSGKSKWVLRDDREETVLTIKMTSSHWAKVEVEYAVQFHRKIAFSTLELLVACGYATNLNRSKIVTLRIEF